MRNSTTSADEFDELLRSRKGRWHREDQIVIAFAILLRYAPSLLSLRSRRRRFRCDGQLRLDLGD